MTHARLDWTEFQEVRETDGIGAPPEDSHFLSGRSVK